MFAYLLVERRWTVGREELADALWPGRLPDSWAAALRGVITDARRFLASLGPPVAELLTTERSGYHVQGAFIAGAMPAAALPGWANAWTPPQIYADGTPDVGTGADVVGPRQSQQAPDA